MHIPTIKVSLNATPSAPMPPRQSAKKMADNKAYSVSAPHSLAYTHIHTYIIKCYE